MERFLILWYLFCLTVQEAEFYGFSLNLLFAYFVMETLADN